MRPSVLLAVLVLAVALAYAKALDVPFFWDDRPLILSNPIVHEGAPLGDFFTRPFWPDPDETRAFFRPLVALSYRLDFLLHGENAAGFHLTNLAFHALNVGLLFALLRRWSASTYVSAIATGAFALLPRLTEAVTWISGRTDVLAATGVLGAFLLWPPPHAERPMLRSMGAACSLLFGLLCKEVALAGVVAILVFEPTLRRSGTLRYRAYLLVPVVLVALGFVAWHEHVLGVTTSDGLTGPAVRIVAAAATWGTYVRMLAFPWDPSLQIGQLESPSGPAAVLGVAVFALATWGLVRSVARKDANVAAGLVVAATSLLLVSHLVPIPMSVLCADRFLYMPAIGLAIAGACAAGARAWAGNVKAIAAAFAFAWLSAAAGYTYLRNEHMTDEAGLWMETAERTERANVLPAMELGNVLFRAGDFREALLFETAAMRVLAGQGKRHGIAWAHAGATAASCLSALGNYSGARALRGALVEEHPTPGGFIDLARVALHELDFAASRAAAGRATAAPADIAAEARRLLALIAELENQVPASDSGELASRVARARFDTKTGRRTEAQREWLEVLGRSDVSADVMMEGAAFLVEFGDIDAANAASRRALSDPGLGASAPKLADVVAERNRIAAHIDALRPRARAYLALLPQSLGGVGH